MVVHDIPMTRAQRLELVAEAAITDLSAFSTLVVRKPLYPYQLEAAAGALQFVGQNDIRFPEFVVSMARQSGKNELSAQATAWMMNRYRHRGGTIVKAAPTFKPQVIISMERLKKTLDNWWNKRKYKTRFNYMVTLGGCTVAFFSADEQSNVVGATADMYMEIDEAQDVLPSKYDKDFVPMRATTNSPVIYYGTTWTRNTLLAQKRREAEEWEKRDGVRRVFMYPWYVVAESNPLYGQFIEDRKSEMGEDHPVFMTQYALKEIDETGAFLQHRHLDSMRGEYGPQERPVGDYVYVMSIDVAGESEQGIDELLRNVKPRKDSTVISIARLDYSEYTPKLPFPTVQIVHHVWWTGRNHETQYQDISKLMEFWNIRKCVVDGGGVGAGIASFLRKRFQSRVEVFAPSSATVSQLGYHMLSMLNMGRLQVYLADGDEEREKILKEFWWEMEESQREMLLNKKMRFFVAEEKGHDDFLKGTAMCAWTVKDLPPPSTVGSAHLFPKGERGAQGNNTIGGNVIVGGLRRGGW